MTASPLPKILRTLRNDVGSVLAAIAEVERCELRAAWGLPDPASVRERAYKDIERRMQTACDTIGITPAERAALTAQITRLQADNTRLTTANAMLMQQRTP